MKLTREHLTQIRPVYLVMALALMSACGSDSGSSSGGSSDVDSGIDADSSAETTSTDLTDVLLTERSSDCSDYADAYV